MKYKIKIGTPNRMFFIKGKLVRTPVEWIADESDLKNIRLKIASEEVSNYLIEEFKPATTSQKKPSKKLPIVQPPKIIKEEKPTTTLDKLMQEV